MFATKKWVKNLIPEILTKHGDLLELQRRVNLLEEKINGKDSQFCSHGVTPRLCEECNSLEGKFWGPSE